MGCCGDDTHSPLQPGRHPSKYFGSVNSHMWLTGRLTAHYKLCLYLKLLDQIVLLEKFKGKIPQGGPSR